MQSNLSFVDHIQQYIKKGQVVLPVFNATALKVQKELVKKEPEVKVLVNIIAGDQALSSQVLQMANSSFYRGLVEVTTIQAAVVRLGIKEVGRISLFAAASNQFRSNDPAHKVVMRKLWQHSVGCAMGARWLARRCDLEDLENEAFLAGLLHDMGKLSILAVIELMHKENKAVKTSKSLMSEAMASLHASQGYDLLKRWNIPEQYCVVARDHHLQEVDQKNLLLILVRLADMVCVKLGIGLKHKPEFVVSSTEEAQLLNVTELDLAELEILLEDAKALSN